MDDFSWIAPATKGLANIFGLNPEIAARGRNMQADYDLTVARTANTQADTGLVPFRRSVLEAQAGTQGALAGKYKADTSKTEEETKGISISNAARTGLSQAFANGAAGLDAEGNLVIKKEAVNNVGGFLMAMDADPEKSMKALRGLAANASTTPRGRAQADGIAASFAPDASFSAPEGAAIQGSKAAASQAEAIAVQQERNRGSLAESIAKGGAAAGQPDQMDLNRQAEAIKLGAEWAMKVPFAGGFLSEDQAYQLSQAARAANPTLNPQDAITKFVRDNPNMLKSNWEMWGKNKVDIPQGIPATVPAAPAAAPTAPAAAAPVAPAPSAAAAQGMPSKAQFAAMPEGGSVVVNGVKYVKQGRQLVKAQ